MDPCDLLFVIPLKEEFETLETWCEVEYLDRQDIIRYYDVHVRNLPYRIFAILLGKTGPTHASAMVEKAIGQCHPKMIFMMGIGGALDRDLLLGDVVIGEEINQFLYDAKATQEKNTPPRGAGKEKPETPLAPGSITASSPLLENKTLYFKFSSRHWDTPAALTSFIENFPMTSRELFQGWQRQVGEFRDSIGFKKNQLKYIHQPPQATLGRVASGDIVGASESFAAVLHGIDRKFKVLEMEAAGLAEACKNREEEVKYLVIRGLSDFADERKSSFDRVQSGGFRRLAMFGAVQYTFALIQSREFQGIVPAGMSAEKKNVSASISPSQSNLKKAETGSGQVEILSHGEQMQLADFINSSGRVGTETARTSFLTEVGLDPSRIQFVTAAGHDFAVLLVDRLVKAKRYTTIDRVMAIIYTDFDGEAREQLDALRREFNSRLPRERK